MSTLLKYESVITIRKFGACSSWENVGPGARVFHHFDQAENIMGGPKTPKIQLSKSGALAKKNSKKVGE